MANAGAGAGAGTVARRGVAATNQSRCSHGMLCTSPAAGGAGGRATSLATKTNDAWRNDGRPQRPRARNRNGPYPLGSRRARNNRLLLYTDRYRNGRAPWRRSTKAYLLPMLMPRCRCWLVLFRLGLDGTPTSRSQLSMNQSVHRFCTATAHRAAATGQSPLTKWSGEIWVWGGGGWARAIERRAAKENENGQWAEECSGTG